MMRWIAKSEMTDSFKDGARLGLYQGNAIAGLLGAVGLFALGFWTGFLFVAMSLLGIAGWWRDYRFALTVRSARKPY